MKTEAETGQRGHKPRSARGPRSWKRPEGPSWGASRGSSGRGHHDFGPLALRKNKFLLLEATSLWDFGVAATAPSPPDLLNSVQGLGAGGRAWLLYDGAGVPQH